MKTIEQKAKDYDEIIERAKTMLAAGEVMYGKENNASQLITDIIPELRESEDERIREELIDFIQWSEDRGMTRHDFHQAKRPAEWIAWLEKQKEHTEGDFARGYDSGYAHCWSMAEKQDYSGLTDFERAIHRGFLCAGVENIPVTIIKETAQDCLAHLPAEWSEDDEKNMATLFEILNCYQRLYDGGVIVSAVNRMEFLARMTELSNWLKSLRPQPHWKPSEEQMKTLERICSNLHLRASDDAPKLDEIIELLKRK